MRISHSAVELYNSCPHKFKLQRIDKLKVDKTFSSLLFGSAIDQALNYILLRKKRNKPVYISTARAIFEKYMDQWDGSNELMFFKSEIGEGQMIDDDPEGNQMRCFEHLKMVGHKMLFTYVNNILPLFKRIIKVQSKKVVNNDDGDEFVFVVDFVAELHDGRIVLFDNKTTSDIKKQYPKKTCVAKSQQLALYTEFEDGNLAGYVCLQKKLVDGKVIWDYMVDSIPEANTEKAFNIVDKALHSIKNGEFQKNEKSCFLYNRRCEYFLWCKHKNDKDLKK